MMTTPPLLTTPPARKWDERAPIATAVHVDLGYQAVQVAGRRNANGIHSLADDVVTIPFTQYLAVAGQLLALLGDTGPAGQAVRAALSGTRVNVAPPPAPINGSVPT